MTYGDAQGDRGHDGMTHDGMTRDGMTQGETAYGGFVQGERLPHGSADPGSREATPAAANPPPAPPVPPPAPAEAPGGPAASGSAATGSVSPGTASAGAEHGDGRVPAPSRRQQASSGSFRQHAGGDGASTLLGRDEHDRLVARLHQAVSGFVDEPRRAVEQADDVFDEAARHLEHALAERRRALREQWRNGDGPGRAEPSGAPAGPAAPVSGEETERLRLALQHYREATEQLLKL